MLFSKKNSAPYDKLCYFCSYYLLEENIIHADTK